MFEEPASASDATLPEVGNTVQGGFGGQNLDFGRVAQGFVESDAHPIIEQAATLTTGAVKECGLSSV